MQKKKLLRMLKHIYQSIYIKMFTPVFSVTIKSCTLPRCSSTKEHEHIMSYSYNGIRSDQIISVTQSCPTLCDPMNRSMPGLPVHHQFPQFTQTHVHRASDAIQPSHPLSSPSPPAPNPSQHQGLFQ